MPKKGLLQTLRLRAKGVGCVRAGERVDVDVKKAGVKGDVLPSGEWAENFSLLNYEDLSKYYEDVLFKPEVRRLWGGGGGYLILFGKSGT